MSYASQAKAAYERGLELEPSNGSLKAGLAQVEEVLGSGATEKERGGAAFKRGEYARAEGHYTAALAAEPDQRSEAAAVLLSNRSACFAKLNRAKCVPGCYSLASGRLQPVKAWMGTSLPRVTFASQAVLSKLQKNIIQTFLIIESERSGSQTESASE